MQLSCYIHRSPLGAGLVDRLADYRWSSESAPAADRRRTVRGAFDLINHRASGVKFSANLSHTAMDQEDQRNQHLPALKGLSDFRRVMRRLLAWGWRIQTSTWHFWSCCCQDYGIWQWNAWHQAGTRLAWGYSETCGGLFEAKSLQTQIIHRLIWHYSPQNVTPLAIPGIHKAWRHSLLWYSIFKNIVLIDFAPSTRTCPKTWHGFSEEIYNTIFKKHPIYWNFDPKECSRRRRF